MTKKAGMIIILLMFTVSLFLSACTSNKSNNEATVTKESTNEASKAPAAAKKPVKLTYKSLAWIPREQEVTKKIIAEWNAANPDIQVDYLQGEWGTVQQELLTSFETGDVPDIFHYWASPIMDWKEKGFLADLSPMLDDKAKADVQPKIWDLFAKDGKTVALPFQYETDVMFYNKKLFKEKGIEPPTADKPWTFDQLRENAIKLTDASKGQYGLVFNGMDFASRFMNETWAIKKDLSIYDKASGEIKVSNDYKNLMKWFHELAYTDKVMPLESLAANFQWINGFNEGKYAIAAGLGVWARELLNTPEQKQEWGMLPPPKDKKWGSYGAVQTLSVPEKSKHKAEAMKFLSFFWNTENQARIGESAFIFPGRISSLQQPQFQTDKFDWKMALKLADNLEIPDFITVPGWGQFIEGNGRTIYNRYLSNEINIDNFADLVQKEGTKTLKEAKAH